MEIFGWRLYPYEMLKCISIGNSTLVLVSFIISMIGKFQPRINTALLNWCLHRCLDSVTAIWNIPLSEK
jgi:hypothetical protein